MRTVLLALAVLFGLPGCSSGSAYYPSSYDYGADTGYHTSHRWQEAQLQRDDLERRMYEVEAHQSAERRQRSLGGTRPRRPSFPSYQPPSYDSPSYKSPSYDDTPGPQIGVGINTPTYEPGVQIVD